MVAGEHYREFLLYQLHTFSLDDVDSTNDVDYIWWDTPIFSLMVKEHLNKCIAKLMDESW
jgi:hypothetical protein